MMHGQQNVKHRKELCVKLFVYQESYEDARSTKYKISY